MQSQPIGNLMIQANFGRASLDDSALLIANHYRAMVAALVTAMLVSHLFLTGAPMLLLVALAVYTVYVFLRFRVFSRKEEQFYTPRVQFWRAQLGIVGVTILLILLEQWGDTGSLWVLYLPALLMVSRYCRRQRVYALVAGEAALAAAGIRLFELRTDTLSFAMLAGEMTARVVAVLLPSFLVHYLARVDITAKHGAHLRDQITQMLLERVLLDSNGDSLWWAIREACRMAVNAAESELYLYDHEHAQLHQLVYESDGYFFGRALDSTTSHIAADAIRYAAIVEGENAELHTEFAAPVYGQPEHTGHPLAVIVLRFPTTKIYDRRVIRLFLTDLLDHIWPLSAHASMRRYAPAFTPIAGRDVHRLCLDDVIDVALDTLCRVLGFSFATISIVDEDQQEIRTVRGKNVPEGWVNASHHPLDSRDILADVLRTGKTEVIAGWDVRFDRAIWKTYQHERMIRVWVSLGHLGTIEAGFYRYERESISPLLIEMLTRYARDVTVAIQNAQLYEREQQYAAILTQLHTVGFDLQTDPRQRDETDLLKQIAQAARATLHADNVMLYPLSRKDGRFTRPIRIGKLEGSQVLQPPDDSDNIVHYIAKNRTPYYQSDAHQDALLVGSTSPPYHSKDHRNAPNRTFAVRQNIYSFAGVPLLVRGELLGVLCINYRTRHQFSPHDQQAITLFAQVAASVIISGQLTREHERRRLEQDLHDMVKSSMRGLILLSNAASESIDTDRGRARRHIHEVRRAAWGILADINMILHNLSPSGYDTEVIHDFIREDLRRMIGPDWSKLQLEIDVGLPRVPLSLARLLLFITREAVINAIEHADAQLISVSVHYRNECLQLAVEDDGCGFDPDASFGQEHRGLINMRKRINLARGHFHIASTPGAGTRIQVDLPQKEQTNATA